MYIFGNMSINSINEKLKNITNYILKMLDKKTKRIIFNSQRGEITEYYIYRKLAEITKDIHNKKILNKISKDELRHYNFWKAYTKKDVEPNQLKIWFYYFLSRVFGLTFGMKLMEKGEELSQQTYNKLSKIIPKIKELEKEEQVHESNLIDMIDEERIRYAGSIVLGLNDALVELTGAIAGLTL